jgi:predicted ATPase/DNA-binding winged helix-turn-helix (wHTH) protein
MSLKMRDTASMESLRVGTFDLYPSERILSLQGKTLELGARAFDLLLVLVEHHGHLVSKATLLERVWPKLVVDENNLPAQVASLRRVLGAGAISTVPGFGYRLDLPLAAPALAASPARAESPEPPRLAVARSTWPTRLGALIGRDHDLQLVQEALNRASLVTIVGTAGVGKSRLAQEVLSREAARAITVSWVSLQPVDDIGHVPSAIALSLGLALPESVDGFAALRQALDRTALLLILHGAEHLNDALAPQLASLVSQTRGLRVLLTSQAPLGVPGEIVYRLAELALPEPGLSHTAAARFAAIELFVERAAAADRNFELTAANTPLVADICRRLDGNALALELAAARVPALGISGLQARLDDRFGLLKLRVRGSNPRHGALHTAFDWSYGLLSASEQQVFNRLGIFAGSFSIEAAARAVADDAVDLSEAIDLIGRLVDRSLVTVLPGDPPRYVLLETARFYARGRLAAKGELESAQRRLGLAVLQLLDSAYEEYWSLDEAIWLHRYEPDIDNVRAAIIWAMQHDQTLAIALYGSAWPLFVETDLSGEGRSRYDHSLTLLSDAQPRTRVARYWEAVANFYSTRQCDRARFAAELASQMHQLTGDARSRYLALTLLAFNWRGDDAAARAAFDQARYIEDPAWAPRLLTQGALTEGALLMSAGEFAAARDAYRRAVRLALTTSERRALAATVSLVELDVACGDPAAALQLGRPLALSLRHSGRRETYFELLMMIFSAWLILGDLPEARPVGAELYALALRLDPSKLYSVLDAMAYLACLDHMETAAARIIACADAAHAAHGQARRRPTEERMRDAAVKILNDRLGKNWSVVVAQAPQKIDESHACALALGLRD